MRSTVLLSMLAVLLPEPSLSEPILRKKTAAELTAAETGTRGSDGGGGGGGAGGGGEFIQPIPVNICTLPDGFEGDSGPSREALIVALTFCLCAECTTKKNDNLIVLLGLALLYFLTLHLSIKKYISWLNMIRIMISFFWCNLHNMINILILSLSFFLQAALCWWRTATPWISSLTSTRALRRSSTTTGLLSW